MQIEMNGATVPFFKEDIDGITYYSFDTSATPPPEPMVNAMLGYDYFLEETVVEGQHLGRTIGFKTANLIYPNNLVENFYIFNSNLYCGFMYTTNFFDT